MERQKVCFNSDLFLNQENNPPVSHLHHEKLTFNNKKREFHKKLIQTGAVMVAPERTETMPRAGADYSMLSTTALYGVSDHKNIKSYRAMKESSKDRAGGVGKGHNHYRPNREHREHKNSEGKIQESNSRERDHEGRKFTLERPSSSSSRKSTENRGKEERKCMASVAFKEPEITKRESKGGSGGHVDLRSVNKRPSSTTESSNLNIKKLRSLKSCKEGSSVIVSSQISSTTTAPRPTYMEKKVMKEKTHWVKMRHETPVVKTRTDSDSYSEDETLSRSVSTSSSSCSSSSPEFEPLQMENQEPLHCMVDHLPSECSDDDRSSEVETAMKSAPTTQDSCLFMASDGDDVEESHPHSLEVLEEKKNPDSWKREKVLKGDKAYTEELVDLHRRLMALRERNILQQIVNLIETTGHFNVTKTTFDFDLFSLDESTVRKLQSYLHAKST